MVKYCCDFHLLLIPIGTIIILVVFKIKNMI